MSEEVEVVPYEYCEEQVTHDKKEIRERLLTLKTKGKDIYSMTVGPLGSQIRWE
ncbi:hypothetical protein [Pajaroellobacter abortibovis]|uniref:hypothetical protein n=1 Tax=Pajaroellobacter abortibovis TaxID=1882918 RepID=UPI0012EC1079|nr:hypothetical protein [Pajaroellobacter abortibovis]